VSERDSGGGRGELQPLAQSIALFHHHTSRGDDVGLDDSDEVTGVVSVAAEACTTYGRAISHRYAKKAARMTTRWMVSLGIVHAWKHIRYLDSESLDSIGVPSALLLPPLRFGVEPSSPADVGGVGPRPLRAPEAGDVIGGVVADAPGGVVSNARTASDARLILLEAEDSFRFADETPPPAVAGGAGAWPPRLLSSIALAASKLQNSSLDASRSLCQNSE
jgi:hypothetical protein